MNQEKALVNQPVERSSEGQSPSILGKDEVSSSNLDSSSKRYSEVSTSELFSFSGSKTGDLIRQMAEGPFVFQSRSRGSMEARFHGPGIQFKSG